MSSFKSKSYNSENLVRAKRHDPKRSFNSKSYQTKLTAPKDTPNRNSLFTKKAKGADQDQSDASGIIGQIKSLTKDNAEIDNNMELIYHVWDKNQLDNLLEWYDSLLEGNDGSSPKVTVKFDDEGVIFSSGDSEIKMQLGKELLHHIYSYCHGPIDTEAKLNYHSRNVGPVDSPEEIIYLTDSPGPIDAIMELLYHTRNAGQVDTVFEWYRLVRNSGDISSRDEIEYHNINSGPQDTTGERLRRSKNVGPVDTADERSFYGLNQQNPNTGPNNSGPIDTPAEASVRGKSENKTAAKSYIPTPKPY